MELKAILKFADQKPFRSFIIELDGGQRIPVRHPETIFFLPNRVKLDHIEVFWDDEAAMFQPVAVSAIRWTIDGNGRKRKSP